MEKCDTCGSEKKFKVGQVGKQNIVSCGCCSLVYLENPMSSDEAKQHYEKEYYSGSNGSASTSCYASGEMFRTKEAEDRLNSLGSIDSVLDVGCGAGFFVKAASARGINAVGIDISENAVKYGKEKGINLLQGDLLSLDAFSENYFDAVTFWASIEHLYEPRKTLQKANKLLKKDGLIVIETGDVGSYQARFFKDAWRLIMPDHNFYYSSKNLDGVLWQSGFVPFKTEYDGFVESIVAQFGLKDVVLKTFAGSSSASKENSSSLKEYINSIAGRFCLGDVMIKYARKMD